MLILLYVLMIMMQDLILEPNKANNIDTGVHVLIPEGYVGLLCPRSSFNIKCIGTPIGVVDAGYTGSIRVVLEPFNVTKVFKGNKIAQLVILPLPKIVMVEGKVIGVKTDRGDRGFGSSGK